MNTTSASWCIEALPAFSDNYLWLIHHNKKAIVVDPGDPTVIEQALAERSLTLVAIFLTHHHNDHTAGALPLQKKWNCTVYAPSSHHPAYDGLHCFHVHDQQKVDLADFPEMSCRVLTLPGHTLDHVGYLIDSQHLFSGDVLFAGGCGRLFEGTPAQMLTSLQKIAALPDNTLIYPAHEYTSKNLAFAIRIEPENKQLLQRIATTKQLRDQHLPTLPTTLGLEKGTNPFLRCDLFQKKTQYVQLSVEEIFATLRTARNDF